MRKIIGVLLIIAAIFGLVLSAGGIVAIWSVKDQAAESISNTLGLVSTTVKATGSALVVADQALGSAVTSVSALEDTVLTLGTTVADTTPVIDTISKMMSADLPNTIQSTQDALTSAANSARSIESTLKLLTAIPLLPVEPYQPTVPLTDALANLNTSLDPLSESFSSMDQSLSRSRGNLTMLSAQVNIIGRRVGEIQTSMSEAKKVISQYQTVTDTLTSQIEAAQQSIAAWLTTLAWVVTILFIWLAFTQVGLFMQGWEMVTSKNNEPVEVNVEVPVEETPEDPSPEA